MGRYAWRGKNPAFQDKHLLPIVKFGGGSIMLGNCVASAGTGSLVEVEGCIDSSQCLQILKNNVWASMTLNTANNQKHNVLDRPSQSPEMDIVENMWCDLKPSAPTGDVLWRKNAAKYLQPESRISWEATGSVSRLLFLQKEDLLNIDTIFLLGCQIYAPA